MKKKIKVTEHKLKRLTPVKVEVLVKTEDIDNMVKKAIKSKSVIDFRMDTIANFLWDSILIVPPYTDLKLLSQKKSIEMSVLSNTAGVSSKGRNAELKNQ